MVSNENILFYIWALWRQGFLIFKTTNIKYLKKVPFSKLICSGGRIDAAASVKPTMRSIKSRHANYRALCRRMRCPNECLAIRCASHF